MKAARSGLPSTRRKRRAKPCRRRKEKISEQAVQSARTTITVEGTVQGVGFRPFVFCLAERLGVRGSVRNAGGTVIIELFAEQQIVEQFLRSLKEEHPPLATITDISVRAAETTGSENTPTGFRIIESTTDTIGGSRHVPPDTAVCDECLADVFDPNNRRYLYPFTNCTNCGPRFTVIQSLPYDRRATTMSCFPMCELCESEFDDPRNRRFHAQPNACWTCGPQLAFMSAATQHDKPNAFKHNHPNAQSVIELRAASQAAIEEVAHRLVGGQIAALKGLSGFHLACNALDETAVAELRRRKRRNAKPFGVMFQSIEQLMQHCDAVEVEQEALLARQRPLVLLNAKAVGHQLADSVSNGIGMIGAMLPYTPLQHLLLRQCGVPLVMTSGNIHEEPIVTGNREALETLASVADVYLLNNRDIFCRFDDSVVRVVDGAPAFMRRSRSWAPEAVPVPTAAESTVLAVGAQLKNTFTFLRAGQAFVSQHLGDASTPQVLAFAQEAVHHFQNLFGLNPDSVACDLHPDYHTTAVARQLADRLGLPLTYVQHHHAHIAACMAEHGIVEDVIGIACDGTGYGADHTAWGGELLLCSYSGYKRLGHLTPLMMPGAEAAIRNPWRMAVSYLRAIAAQSVAVDQGPVSAVLSSLEERLGKQAITAVTGQLDKSINSPLTSSCGRLFDAASAILGLGDTAEFEGQAAMKLESLAWQHGNSRSPSSVLADPQSLLRWRDDNVELDGATLMGSLCQAVGGDVAAAAYRFHRTVAEMFALAAMQLAHKTRIGTVCLSGGVFQNKLLCEIMVARLREYGLRTLVPRKLPPNDGGISLGQAVIAAMSASGE